MNVNLLTIDGNLAADPRPFPSRSDSNNKSITFDKTFEDEKLHVKIHDKPSTDKINERVTDYEKPLSDNPSEFSQSINKKQNSEKVYNNDDKTESKEQNIIPSSIKQQNQQANTTQSSSSELPILVELDKEGTPTKNEAKPSIKVAQITNYLLNKKPSVTGHTVKSAQIKVLHATEQGQLGIKTILPAKSNGLNGLKATTLEKSKSSPSVKKQPEAVISDNKAAMPSKTIPLIEKGNTKELAGEISNSTGESTNAINVKHSAMNINPATVQDKTTETKLPSKKVDLEKPEPTEDTHAKTKKSQTISNLSNINSKESLRTGNNPPANPGIQKINTAVVQAIAGRAKDQSSSASNKRSSQGFEQILSHNNSQTLIIEQSPISAKKATTANLPNQSSNDVSADIGKQILESVQRSISHENTSQQITVRLNPPELGKVLIKFQQHDTELTGLMEVNKTQTRLEIEQALPQIIRNLTECGVQIKRLEVMLSNEQQPGQGTHGNQSMQDGGTQQQYSANPGQSENDSSLSEINEWPTGNNSYENLSELQGTLFIDSSINILI